MGSRRWQRNRRLKCGCGGYHFPHRRGGGMCFHSPSCDYHRAKRDGDPLAEYLLPVSKGGKCPF